jgi:PAP2 superfamily
MKRMAGTLIGLGVVLLVTSNARADDITDWNETMLRAGLVAGSSPLVMTRNAAMVHAAVFDAVNGIERRYTSIHVDPAGPPRASRRAAAVQAAYAILTKLYGSGAATPNAAQQATLDARRAVSLVEIGADERPASINSGITWGQVVADAIWTWRSSDGFTMTGAAPEGSLPGEWRRTPNLPVSPALSAPGAGYLQFSHMVPWVMASPSAFQPTAPPSLTSSEYTRDFNEVKTMGSLESAARTPDETLYSLFWNSTSATYFWNRATVSLIESRNGHDDGKGNGSDNQNGGRRHSLLENARLLGQLNLAMADAAIGCWEAKYFYNYWRPITAIRDPLDDGNPDTTPDPTWVPLFATPGHPDYPSGHSCTSGAAGAVLSHEFKDRIRFSVESDLMLGVTRDFHSLSAALEEVKNARIFSGIHFRTACDAGQTLGESVAGFVLENALQRIR